jgi:hypothetical protein
MTLRKKINVVLLLALVAGDIGWLVWYLRQPDEAGRS